MKYKLDDIEKKLPFQAPENYFEELPLKVQGKIDAKRPLYLGSLTLSWKLALAAVPVLVLAITIGFLLPQEKTSEQILAEVPEADLVAYLGMDDYEWNEIALTFDNELLESFEDDSSLEILDLQEDDLGNIYLEYGLETDYL